MYYANNVTTEFGDVCPSLITLDITHHNNTIIINHNNNTIITNDSVSVDIIQSDLLTLHIGKLPGK